METMNRQQINDVCEALRPVLKTLIDDALSAPFEKRIVTKSFLAGYFDVTPPVFRAKYLSDETFPKPIDEHAVPKHWYMGDVLRWVEKKNG